MRNKRDCFMLSVALKEIASIYHYAPLFAMHKEVCTHSNISHVSLTAFTGSFVLGLLLLGVYSYETLAVSSYKQFAVLRSGEFAGQTTGPPCLIYLSGYR
jgi:hypothetical protein